MYTVNLSNPNRVMHIDAFRFYVNGPMIVFTRAVSHDSGLDENPTDVVALPVADVKSVTMRHGVISHRILAPYEQHVVPTMATTGDLVQPTTSQYPSQVPPTSLPFTDLANPRDWREDPTTVGYGDSLRSQGIGRLDTATTVSLRRVHPTGEPDLPVISSSNGRLVADYNPPETQW